MLQLPGKRTRRLLLEASKPPAVVWMRGAMRLGLAGLVWMAGFTHVAVILAVLAVVNVFGAIELQVARVLLEVYRSAKEFLIKWTWQVTPPLAEKDKHCADCGRPLSSFETGTLKCTCG